MKLSLNGKPEIERGERRDAVSLHADTTRGKGPDKDTPALLFGEESWAELPPLDLDGDKAFSITMWVYHPNDAGSFIVAGQDDSDDGNRGWTFAISERQLSFKMTGDKLEGDDEGRSSVTIIPNNLRRLPAGKWTHVTVTHDGSGERAGLRFYMNGGIIPVQGSEFFTKVEGSIRVDRPFLLGKRREQRQRRPRRDSDPLHERRRNCRSAGLQSPDFRARGRRWSRSGLF